MAIAKEGPVAEDSSIDLSDEIEEIEMEPLSVEMDPMSVEELVVPEDSYSVDNLLALTQDEEQWDIDAHAKTLAQAAKAPRSIQPPPPRAAGIVLPSPRDFSKGPRTESQRPPPLRMDIERTDLQASRYEELSEGSKTLDNLLGLVQARVSHLETSGDAIGLARAHMESACLFELFGDDSKTATHLEAALVSQPNMVIAHTWLRRRMRGRAALGGMLAHLEHEAKSTSDSPALAETMVEKARILDAISEDPTAIRKAWEAALAYAPEHPVALFGLEAELWSEVEQADDQRQLLDTVAKHKATLAKACASQPELAAWIHVERAELLDRVFGKYEEAHAALKQAVLLDPSVGPVRDEYVLFLSAQEDWSTLVAMLDDEAQIEPNSERAARLELDAACYAREKLRDADRACSLLERAFGRAPTVPAVDRRVIEDLVSHYESAGSTEDVIRVRQSRLLHLSDPAQLGYELRSLALLREKAGDIDGAIFDLERARSYVPEDEILLETLDRLLERQQRTVERISLWTEEAARLPTPTQRAKAYARSAHLAEADGERDEAINLFRRALQESPSDSEVVDALARLLCPSPSERVDGETRILIEHYVSSATRTIDVVRKIAYLEQAAVLWETILGDPRRACRLYEETLGLEPGRRSAILGLIRTGTRASDGKAVAKALLEEARQTSELAEELDLKTRAAKQLVTADPARALSLVLEVLTRDPANTEARGLETHLHEDAGRFAAAATSLKTRIDHVHIKEEKLKLLLSLANLQETQLRDHESALTTLRSARSIAPDHLVPPTEIARILNSLGDQAALRHAYDTLAQSALMPEERAMFHALAGEVEELRIGDEAAAARAYTNALSETPNNEWIAERLHRVLVRRARKTIDKDPSLRLQGVGLAERITLASKQLEKTREPSARRRLVFQLANLHTWARQEVGKAVALLESLLEEIPTYVPALRLLENILHRNQEWARLARVLSLQGNHYMDRNARLGSLFRLNTVEEWRLSQSEGTETLERILALDPKNLSALDSLTRRTLPEARNGERDAKEKTIGAFRAFRNLATEASSKMVTELALALALEAWSDPGKEGRLHEAMDHYRSALEIDGESVTAATGLARLASRLGDLQNSVTAALSLADLAKNSPKVRARYLHDASGFLLTKVEDEPQGPARIRADRAAILLEQALEADPDSIVVAASLVSLRRERGEHAKLVDALRDALLRATVVEAIVMLGTEIATVCRDHLNDLGTAIEAVKKIREHAPSHTASLLTLAELHIAARNWDEAVAVLVVLSHPSHEAQARLTALFALARIYEKVTKELDKAEQALRGVLEIEPENPRGLRALLRRLAKPGGDAARDNRKEMATLLERLSNVEPDRQARAGLFLEAADLRQDLHDPAAAERALIEALALSPEKDDLIERLAKFYRGDAAAHARGLQLVVTRGRELGASNPKWLAALGHIEIDRLGKTREGIAHLKQAILEDKSLVTAKYELATALARVGSNDEACKTLFDLMIPDPKLLMSLPDPASALDLLERTLGAERRREESVLVSELRAIAGDLDEGRQAWLRGRRISSFEAHHAPLDRATLLAHVAPSSANHAYLDIAAAVFGIEAKMFRADLTELGISSRERVGARSGHPARLLLDRVAKALSISTIELVITPTVNRPRLLIQDEPWVVLPQSILELPEPAQLATFARLLTRVALSVPWLEELPPPQMEAFLTACARTVVPNYGQGELDVIASRVVAQYEPIVQKHLSRKHRKQLEELAPKLSSSASRPIPIDQVVSALAFCEMRTTFVLTGDLLATVDELRALDAKFLKETSTPGRAALSAVLQHTYAGDVCRFGLTSECTALRRRVGSTWTG